MSLAMLGPKRTLAVVAFVLVGCSTPVAPASTPTSGTVTLRLYATTAVAPLLNDLVTTYSQFNPAVTISTSTGNLETMLQQLNTAAGYLLTTHLPDDPSLSAWPIGQDAIAIIVHPQVDVRSLSAEALRNIYLGAISDWSILGGTAQSIQVMSRESGSGTRAEFESLLIGERMTTQAAQIVPSSTAMLDTVASLPGSVGYVSMGYITDSVPVVAVDNILPTSTSVAQAVYPLRSTIFAVGHDQPEGAYLEFVGWVQSPEGQAVVAQRYAPLLNP
jgi:phosphate transport system substrate-binding protein